MSLTKLETEFKARQRRGNELELKLKDAAVGIQSAGSAWIENQITQGEILLRAKAECEKEGAIYLEWVAASLGLQKMQASRLARIAVHKEQCRYLMHTGAAADIKGLQTLIPKASEPPVEVPADYKKTAYTGRLHKLDESGKAVVRNGDDWHTPSKYVEAARAVMGSIDLDPFSSAQANGTVKAERYFTVEDDALTAEWAGCPNQTVFMNPPYGKLATDAVNRFIDQYQAKSFTQAIVLMNSSTDTKWCQALLNACSAFCLTDHRIAFDDAGGKAKSGNTKGQIFFYFGRNTSRFITEFGKHGFTVVTGLTQSNRLELVKCQNH